MIYSVQLSYNTIIFRTNRADASYEEKLASSQWRVVPAGVRVSSHTLLPLAISKVFIPEAKVSYAFT